MRRTITIITERAFVACAAGLVVLFGAWYTAARR